MSIERQVAARLLEGREESLATAERSEPKMAPRQTA
jgi:hypothetical protein